MRVQVAPWFPHCLCTTWHRYRLKPGEPPVITIVREQKLAAPDRAVVAEAESIENDAKYLGSVQWVPIFSETGCDMRVVMLDL
jgi:hypothetical protein